MLQPVYILNSSSFSLPTVRGKQGSGLHLFKTCARQADIGDFTDVSMTYYMTWLIWHHMTHMTSYDSYDSYDIQTEQRNNNT